MAKIALLVPFEDMLATANQVISDRKTDIFLSRCVDSYNVVDEARDAVAAGANIIIARGRQARLIKNFTNIPVVEIRMHPQEVGLMLLEAKKLVAKDCPHVGIVAYSNMLCDMSYMELLYGVKISVGNIEDDIDARSQVKKLMAENVDLIIGGETACQEAAENGVYSMLIKSLDLSITEALNTAESVAFAMDSEKQNAAQYSAVLDSVKSSVINITRDGVISHTNQHMEDILGKNVGNVIGMSVFDVFPQIERSAIMEVLSGVRDSYASSIIIQNKSWILVVSSIQYDEKIIGALLSFQIADRLSQMHAQRAVLGGFTAKETFDSIRLQSEGIKQALSLARMYALTDSPMLIEAAVGSEYQAIAEAIHNNSNRRKGAFVSVNVTGMNERKQMEIIFGLNDEKGANRSAVVRANRGTLLLIGVEYLSPWAQHELYRILQPSLRFKNNAQGFGSDANIRLIAVARTDLMPLLKSGQFSPSLYYLMRGLTIRVPSLSQRPEDLTMYFDSYFKEYTQKYNRNLHLSGGAYRELQKLSWNGNCIQLRGFTERLVITSHKKNIDEVQIRRLHDELYPQTEEINGTEKVVVYQSPEAAELLALMKKHNGSRSAIAEELGISTTTLWRRMKKYGLS